MAAWDRAERTDPETGKTVREPERAYLHFTTYRDLGPLERTLEKVRKHFGVSQRHVEQESADWNWTARCDQFDAHVQATIDRAFLTEAAKRGKQRAQAFTALLTKSLQALQKVDVDKASLRDVAAAMKAACEGLRLEEGLETARVRLEYEDVRSILSRLPAEVRAPLLRAWATELGPGRDTELAGGVPVGVGPGSGED